MPPQPTFIRGRHYIVYPDGAFTMPMAKHLARHYLAVFPGSVMKTHDPSWTERLPPRVRQLGLRLIRRVAQLFFIWMLPIWLGYVALPWLFRVFL